MGNKPAKQLELHSILDFPGEGVYSHKIDQPYVLNFPDSD